LENLTVFFNILTFQTAPFLHIHIIKHTFKAVGNHKIYIAEMLSMFNCGSWIDGMVLWFGDHQGSTIGNCYSGALEPQAPGDYTPSIPFKLCGYIVSG
jgi:hypothetical protein